MPSLFQIPKVASTSMVHALLRVLGEEHYVAELEIGRLHTTLRRLMPSPRPDEDLVDFTSFLVVRHPFQRILSAYRSYSTSLHLATMVIMCSTSSLL